MPQNVCRQPLFWVVMGCIAVLAILGISLGIACAASDGSQHYGSPLSWCNSTAINSTAGESIDWKRED